MKLDQDDAERIYEWYLALTQAFGEPCCENCKILARKLEKFLGEESVTELKKIVEKHPYFINGKIVNKKK